MIYKVVASEYAVWVSKELSFENIKLNFIAKKGHSKFERDFKLKNRFIDYDQAISLWLPEGDFTGFESIVADIRAEYEKVYNAKDLTYIFALEDFVYDNHIQENDTLKFLGNITLHLRIRDWNAERTKNKI